jgi:hypothetical protein
MKRVALVGVIVIGLVEAAVGYGTLLAHARLDTDVEIYGYWLESSVSFPVILLLAILLLVRRPEHLVTRLLAGSALASGLQFAAGSLAHWLAATGRPDGVVALSLVASLGQISGILLLLAMILVFPTGRLVSRRWRPVMVIFVVGALASMWAGLSVEQILPVGPDVANPLAGSSVGWLSLVGAVGYGGAGVIGGIVSVGVRYHRSRGLERQQLRWFFFALVAGLLSILLIPYGSLGWTLGPTLVSVGMGVAILRYRLYDIGRIVSRTVTYALLTGVLVAVYAAGVLGAQLVLGPENAPDLVVAGATLAVAALARPLRARIQTVVDRRFNRSRYDAAGVVASFGVRLRDEVDLGTLTGDLRATVAATVGPRSLTLWLREVEP